MTYYGENPILDCVDGCRVTGSMSTQGRCTCTDPARTCECGDLGYDPDTYSPSDGDEDSGAHDEAYYDQEEANEDLDFNPEA